MAKDNTLDRVLGTIRSQGFPIDRVERNTMILTVGLDSLDRVELAMALEEEFKRELPYGIEINWQTVGDICSYLEVH